MAKFKKSMKIAPKNHFLPSGLISAEAVGPPNRFQSLFLVILHGFRYRELEKSKNLGFWQLFIWGFFHPWANCANPREKMADDIG